MTDAAQISRAGQGCNYSVLAQAGAWVRYVIPATSEVIWSSATSLAWIAVNAGTPFSGADQATATWSVADPAEIVTTPGESFVVAYTPGSDWSWQLPANPRHVAEVTLSGNVNTGGLLEVPYVMSWSITLRSDGTRAISLNAGALTDLAGRLGQVSQEIERRYSFSGSAHSFNSEGFTFRAGFPNLSRYGLVYFDSQITTTLSIRARA